jgi:putative DNA-invertase from lambdoid prophage Rac
MSHLAYFRCSGPEQSIESQRHAMLTKSDAEQFSEEFTDEGVSGAVPAVGRPGFARLLAYARRGDVIHVYAVDRLGRDALDVQATVRTLLDKGVAVEVHGLGRIARGAGELILAVLAQVADMERLRIKERTEAGRAKARAVLIETGKTHKGKASMGRPKHHDPLEIAQWRLEQSASISATAEHFRCSPATIKRYCAIACRT